MSAITYVLYAKKNHELIEVDRQESPFNEGQIYLAAVEHLGAPPEKPGQDRLGWVEYAPHDRMFYVTPEGGSRHDTLAFFWGGTVHLILRHPVRLVIEAQDAILREIEYHGDDEMA